MLDQICNHDLYELIQHGPVIDHDTRMEQLGYIKDRLVFEYFYDRMMDIGVHRILCDLYYKIKTKNDWLKAKKLKKKVYQKIELHESHFIGRKSNENNRTID